MIETEWFESRSPEEEEKHAERTFWKRLGIGILTLIAVTDRSRSLT